VGALRWPVLRIALDIGHMGKKSSPADRGSVNGNHREAEIVLDYAVAAWKQLEHIGHTVYLLCYDNYSKRQEFCDAIKADAHVQCHLNSTSLDTAPGSYGLVAYRADGHVDSAKLSSIISRHLTEDLSEVVSQINVKALTKDGKGYGGYGCLKSNMPSILFEPLFINNELHLNFLLNQNGINTVGTCLADALDEWGKVTKR